MLKRINRFVRNLRQSSTSKKVENSPRSLLEIITDVATIISAFTIVIAIVQMCSQNKQFNDSFELSNKQFQYQLKQDSLKDKADSVKDYRDSVNLQLAINEFEENKKNQESEAKRNESQFQKNIQTYQELVRTNKQSNDYVVKSQSPFLTIEFKSISIVRDTIISLVIRFKNLGVRRPFLKKMTHIFVNNSLKSYYSLSSQYFNTPIGNDSTVFTIGDYSYINIHLKEEREYEIVNFILEISYLDELTNKIINQRFHYKISDLRSLSSINECNSTEKQILDKFIESKRKEIFKN